MTWVLVCLVTMPPGAYWGQQGEYIELALSGLESQMVSETTDPAKRVDRYLSVRYGYRPDQCQVDQP